MEATTENVPVSDMSDTVEGLDIKTQWDEEDMYEDSYIEDYWEMRYKDAL